jgi:multidrug transporter EmrE-like cation transporter
MPVAIALAVISILLSAAAQVILKLGMNRLVTGGVARSSDTAHIIAQALGSPIVWLGLLTYGASAMAWLAVLARLDLSLAYPFVALGLVLTCIFGVLMFHEPLSALKLVGVALVVIGVLLVGLSARHS